MTLASARAALLADARAAAQRPRAEARAAAAARVAEARRQAEELIARGRAQGEAEGRAQAALDEGVALSLARRDVLAARREAYDDLRARARAAVLGLRADPELSERLRAAVRRDLGAAAELEVDPDGRGGVRGRAGGRRVDYTLVALADRCVDGLGPALRRLWT